MRQLSAEQREQRRRELRAEREKQKEEFRRMKQEERARLLKEKEEARRLKAEEDAKLREEKKKQLEEEKARKAEEKKKQLEEEKARKLEEKAREKQLREDEKRQKKEEADRKKVKVKKRTLGKGENRADHLNIFFYFSFPPKIEEEEQKRKQMGCGKKEIGFMASFLKKTPTASAPAEPVAETAASRFKPFQLQKVGGETKRRKEEKERNAFRLIVCYSLVSLCFFFLSSKCCRT